MISLKFYFGCPQLHSNKVNVRKLYYFIKMHICGGSRHEFRVLVNPWSNGWNLGHKTGAKFLYLPNPRESLEK